MYALVKTGGKQYRVAKDDKILVERIAADEGAEIILDDIIMLGDGDKVTVGTPRVDGAAVSAKVVRQTRGPKIIIFRRKRRNRHIRHWGMGLLRRCHLVWFHLLHWLYLNHCLHCLRCLKTYRQRRQSLERARMPNKQDISSGISK